MKVIFCYTNVPDARSADAIRKYAPTAEWIQTPLHFDYNNALMSRWGSGEDIVIIEGDKEITDEVIPSFEACNEPWCTYSYYTFPTPYQRLITVGLGCTKYSADLQRQIPAEEISQPHLETLPCPDCDGKGCWRYMDTRISFAILNRCIVFTPHVHGELNHYHEYPSDWAKQRGLE
ncbi:MAG: hypothetical protein ACREHG_08715 [Candidatus Saccharimonadales bacterium]